MNRFKAATGLLLTAAGLVWMIPVSKRWVERGSLDSKELAIAAIGPILIAVGMAVVSRGISRLRDIPPPVRAILLANGLFVAFCAMELCDRLVREDGRIGYWTTVAFLPALGVFYGQLSGQKWAWWTARVVVAIFTIWFLVILCIIPFGHLYGPAGKIPWWGRIYACTVTLVFASISAYVFRLLGRRESRDFYSAVKNIRSSS